MTLLDTIEWENETLFSVMGWEQRSEGHYIRLILGIKIPPGFTFIYMLNAMIIEPYEGIRGVFGLMPSKCNYLFRMISFGIADFQAALPSLYANIFAPLYP